MTYITATPGAVLLTEERAGNIITVPLPINLEYIGISKLEPMIDEQPDWEPIGSGTITEDTLSRWFKRYLAPMVADMVSYSRYLHKSAGCKQQTMMHSSSSSPHHLIWMASACCIAAAPSDLGQT